MTAVVIRDARLDDAAEVARLCTLLAYPVDAGGMKERLATLLASPAHAVKVAGSSNGNGDLLGMVAAEWRLMIEFGHRAEITALIVDPRARRLGLGQRLVDAACDWIRDHGGCDVFVRSNILRPESHAFYPSTGFVLAKTQHVYVRALTSPNDA
ncbi:GNAT family N-acetyltransferase [Pseudoxanthomonas japonensis]|nr:GNAT family N-acetyltransferase [Pseudoxanthomonas japonensis]